MSVNSKMTALADGIRELSGSNTAKGLDDMTIDVNTANAEITEQTDLIAQIASALEGKTGGSGGGGSVEYETVNITENTTTIPFTLKRITATYGISTNHQSACGTRNLAHQNTSAINAYYAGGIYSFVRELSLSNASLSSGTEFFAPYVAIFVNDPSQEAIYEENT